MRLINVENFELKVADEALLIKPIRRLFNQDRSDRKEKFYQQLSYLYFMVDPRSTYIYLIDEEERSQAIIKQEGLPSNFKPSDLLKEAMEIYRKHTITPAQRLLKSSLIAAENLSKFLESVDLKEEDDNGKLKYDASKISSTLKNVEGIVTTLQNLQKKVDQELNEQTKVRGSQELTVGDMMYMKEG